MSEPQKPFACMIPECGKSFTNEDHLNVHTKKHDMALQLGSEQKAAFVADQTPTPTRFIRNCEEVGLFQDLQNVNPFDETFKRAMENKAGHNIESIPSSASSDDVLHTPQMFPLTDADKTMYTSTNNQSNVVISRSSSDEAGVVKEFETTTISKHTNEVIISKIVNKQDTLDRVYSDEHRNIINESVSYRNNVIKIHSNVEIKKDNIAFKPHIPVTYADVVNDSNDPEILNTNVDKPLMSQKSINNVIDSFTAVNDRRDQAINTDTNDDCTVVENRMNQIKNIKREDIEVIVKIPGHKKYIKMKAMEELLDQDRVNARERIKNAILDKYENNCHLIPKANSNIIQIPTGTLIPVTVLNPVNASVILPTIPIPAPASKVKINPVKQTARSTKKNKVESSEKHNHDNLIKIKAKSNDKNVSQNKTKGTKVIEKSNKYTRQMNNLEMRSAAAKRYRDRVKLKTQAESQENLRLKEENRLMEIKLNDMKRLIKEHVKKCTNCDDLASVCLESTSIT